ncbi:decaprenyl-diphosphate synthase subunit 2 [Exaiptasia diaphana]|uniref:Decaprenyl-diphosphate synthase subunit 2 n=1 Tax=Exaiptasia diaphana TaxID=2652724 RepID=A0A913X0L5_EXADI|nr:decaprenyl-diphosphate synthase subunit 2 [Exaiptasia diaphana]KXJ27494.1 Decaprenyl-diphosphate synthase subunit 2 [Exaiptasia diaphana]
MRSTSCSNISQLSKLFSHRLRHVSRRFLWSYDNLAKKDDFNQALSDAEKLVGYPTSFLSLRCLLSDELSNVAMYMKRLIGSKHPLLKTARGFVYDGHYSMQTRGLLVLLVAKAALPCLSKDEVTIGQEVVSGIYPGQRQLAEITEMINTAYLIHCGVVNLDSFSQERFKDMEFGNKMSVLTGDFLLANACTGLAQLNNTVIVDMISQSIGHLMEGQAMQTNCDINDLSQDYWYQLVYKCKTSLLANSCHSVLKLVNHTDKLQEKAFQFGENIAYAHQLKEELQSTKIHQSPLSITSLPVILSLNNDGCTDLVNTLIKTKAKDDFDSYEELSKGLHQFIDSDSVKVVEELMAQYSHKALEALKDFPDSETKLALENIVHTISH